MIDITSQIMKVIENRASAPGLPAILEIEKIVRSKYLRDDIKKEFEYLTQAAKVCVICGINFKDYCKQFPKKE